MDYKAKAEAALRERAEIFEKRKALFDSDATDAEKREQAERMDADMDRLAGEAREFVEAGEREAEIRGLSERAGALSIPTPGKAEKREDADEFAEGLRAVALGESRSYEFTASARAFDADAIGLVGPVSDGTGVNKSGTSGPVTPDTFVATLLESLEDTSDLLARVRKISTSSGEVMTWPRRNSKVGGAFQSVLEANKYPAATDGDFSLFNLSAHKFGAIAEIPFEALSDPALNIGALVAEEMGEDLAESLAAEILSGSTLTQNVLDSIILDNTVPVFAGDSTDIAIYDALIDIQHSLRQKYRRNASWTISDDTERRVRKIKDAENNYIWQPSVVAGSPDMLLGKPVAVEALMPNAPQGVGASAKVALYGDLKRYFVLRNVRNISVTRSDEFGFDRDTVALKINWRGDGGVTDPQALASGTITNP